MSATTPTTAARFEAFAAHHGPIKSVLAERILGRFMEQAIDKFFEHPNDGSLGDFVAGRFKCWSPDILACLELAADWCADPMKAAERQLRADLDAKAEAEARARKAKEDADTQAAVKAKADAFMAQLQSGAVALA